MNRKIPYLHRSLSENPFPCEIYAYWTVRAIRVSAPEELVLFTAVPVPCSEMLDRSAVCFLRAES